MRYDQKRDFYWLVVKPWIWIPRIVQIFGSILILTLSLLIQGKSKNKETQKNLAKKLLNTFYELGPCFIKVGQALSTRPDLIRKDWLEELTKLQDDLPAFSHTTSISIIEEEFSKSVNELFEEFPDKPIAAASLGQVYRARLTKDYWVAVKVQRPDLIFIIRRDLVILRCLCILGSPILPLNLGVGLDEIIDEFGRCLFEEIDYEKEADNADKFRKLFEKTPTITIPKVERNLSSRRVITTSWIEGVKLRDRKELQTHKLNISALIKTGVISGIQQLLEYGYFHADPHPGNMFALNGTYKGQGNIAYVDFGMMDSITNEDRITLTGAVVSLINKDFRSLANAFKKLGFLSSNCDITPIIPVLDEVLGGAFNESVEAFNFKQITDQFSELMYEYPFRVPARFALIIRAVVSQEGLALKLDPKFKIVSIAYPYIAKRLISADTEEMINLLLDVIFDSAGRLKLDNIESLLTILSVNSSSNKSELIYVANSGIKLLFSSNGSMLRKRLLLNLIEDDRLTLKDIKSLAKLILRTFTPKKIALDVLNGLSLNPA